MHPRRAALGGLIFPVIALGYYVFSSTVEPGHTDPGVLVMLLALGVAMSIMAYVLFAGVAKN
jgi:hypothetical protein